ncbi:hypothetical protein V500_08900 [Pseudogymnoascus sp. VKM F-4518 (FW-2643)]|nr:hypothetical protein V500_08900 [Pseudogymnoascus sp. VKM F-4518 (FW-2643)]
MLPIRSAFLLTAMALPGPPQPPAAQRKVSFRDKLDLILGLFSLIGAVTYAAITVYAGGTYNHIYVKYCKSKGIVPEFVHTKAGVTGFWVGDKSAKYIVINFHGGGFAMDATPEHLNFWSSVQNDLADQGVSTAWFYPTYTLTPHAAYPTQFEQAVEALRYVFTDVGRSPSEVILTGDSAGSNLCLAILSHLTHPSEHVPQLSVEEPLKAIITMSPWVSFDTTWPSTKTNIHKDIDALDALHGFSRMYLNGLPSDPYTEPVLAPEGWWDGAKVEQVLVVAGADEIFVDPIHAWVTKFRVTNPNITYMTGEHECHIAPIIWPVFGDFRETKQGRAITDWMRVNLSGNLTHNDGAINDKTSLPLTDAAAKVLGGKSV